MINWTRLDTSNAFNSGHDLWFVALDDSSKTYQRLDWLLNFQLYSSKRKQMPKLSEPLQEILQLCDIQDVSAPGFNPDKLKLIMVPAYKNIPAKWVVLSSSLNDKSQAIEQMVQVWSSFTKPSCRFFLPSGFDIENFKTYWEQAGLLGEASIYLDV